MQTSLHECRDVCIVSAVVGRSTLHAARMWSGADVGFSLSGSAVALLDIVR